MKLKQQNKNEQTFCLWVSAASNCDHSWEHNCYLSWDFVFSTKFCHLGDLVAEICARLTKIFLKTTIFREAIIVFLYVYKILSVCCQDIFADECRYKRTVCYEGTSIFVNTILM